MAKLKYPDLRRAVINTCLRMNEEGINQGTSGNVSVRTPEGFLITASGIPYARMKPEHIVEMDLDGGYIGEYLPSTEWRMHLDIFRRRAEAGAIVHTHSIYATALACLRMDIPAFHYMIGIAGGSDIRCSDYAEFGTPELSKVMLKALEDRSACLLGNHGQIAFGPDLEKALWRAGEVETIAQQYWAALQVGKPVILKANQMGTVLARMKTYGKQSGEFKTTDAASVTGLERRDAPGTPAAKKRGAAKR
ncbi:class II aldolase/adducin family protein [Aestuariivirga sp.]|uniref:class II aldolase/adducin family protein n=1 Tax=Aestuariivirga sp. TaxID=2650926 RepID=UPI0025C2C33B|nr:class II aldolase/adducin family protein [Aestuariivirga sp.]MCA3556181.1 class II aldolase/adducin family protein [Aestuariivirga sp.]